jgi:hypothetical protein
MRLFHLLRMHGGLLCGNRRLLLLLRDEVVKETDTNAEQISWCCAR